MCLVVCCMVTQLPVDQEHLVKTTTVKYNSLAMNPMLMRVIMFRFLLKQLQKGVDSSIVLEDVVCGVIEFYCIIQRCFCN